MPGQVSQYSSRLVPVVFNGRVLTGMADGTFVKVSMASDSATSYAGADGSVVVSWSADDRATVAVTLHQSSPDHAFLEAASVGHVIGPLEVRDLLQGKVLVRAATAWVQRRADIERGKEAGATEWTFGIANLERHIPG
ncbi:phage protein [Corallococcus sp. EGB]|uniref:phage structural protein n=1 Tax=Corallococcus sp. EGB TaxID=1521117 RepID=UPI001CBBDD69|nr:phage protein [Corallococcus sp. EGB]